MKLVSLNVWGGRQGKLLFDYLKQQSTDTDIFCFQEVFSADIGAPETYNGWHMFLLRDVSGLLPEFFGYFDAKSSGYADDGKQAVSWPVWHGSAVFVRKNLQVTNYECKTVANSVTTGAPPVEGLVRAQIFNLSFQGRSFAIVNTHGMSRPGDKLDTPQRLEQSKKLLNIMNSLKMQPLILCGDFNLMPQTQSIVMLEKNRRNLIKEFKIENTRNEISWKQFNNRQYFADYTFVSPEIKVKSFEVPYNEVSDHLPMVLEFNI